MRSKTCILFFIGFTLCTFNTDSVLQRNIYFLLMIGLDESRWPVNAAMYTVAAHQGYSRGERRQQRPQQPQASQDTTAAASECSATDAEGGTRRRPAKHRQSITSRLFNYIKQQFSPEEGQTF